MAPQAQPQNVENIEPIPPSPRIHIWLKLFQKLKPRSFSTATTPVEARYWISHIEKIFNILEVEDVFKVRLATYKLDGDAHWWWEVEKLARGGDDYVATLSWADFRDLFYKRYFSEADMRVYRREFWTIRQSNGEPVTDFAARFSRLAGIVGAKEAGTQVVQAEKFKYAICEKFWPLITHLKFNEVSEVVNAVKNIEYASWDDGYNH